MDERPSNLKSCHLSVLVRIVFAPCYKSTNHCLHRFGNFLREDRCKWVVFRRRRHRRHRRRRHRRRRRRKGHPPVNECSVNTLFKKRIS